MISVGQILDLGAGATVQVQVARLSGVTIDYDSSTIDAEGEWMANISLAKM
jgi:hypothetical protein